MSELAKDEEGSGSGSDDESGSGSEGGMGDMFEGMMCADSDSEGEEGGAADEREGDEEGGGDEEMSEEEMIKTDLGVLLKEFSLDFKHFSALEDCGGGHSYAHIARGGDRGIIKAGIPTLKARKVWKTAVARAKEKEAEMKEQATSTFSASEAAE